MSPDTKCVICGADGHRAGHCPWYVPITDQRAWLLPLLQRAVVPAAQKENAS